MIIYVYDQYAGNRSKEYNTNQLVSIALKQYVKENGNFNTVKDSTFHMNKTQKGKPYIEGLPLHFSVSHSEHMWVCLVGEVEIGVDIQFKAHSNYEAISRRFYQPEEQEAVAIGGISSFISIWCRKEAFIKLLGLTIGETIEWLNVAKDNSPAMQIQYFDRMITFSEIEVHPEFVCVAAMDQAIKKEEIWIRQIQVD
jgi:phosphopantetheinyl transferase